MRRAIAVKPGELEALGWAWLYLFALIMSYYIMRPIRDTMGIANTALRDAVTLCDAIRRHIAGHGTLQEALNVYHAAMEGYAVPAVDSSVANLRRMITRDEETAIFPA